MGVSIKPINFRSDWSYISDNFLSDARPSRIFFLASRESEIETLVILQTTLKAPKEEIPQQTFSRSDPYVRQQAPKASEIVFCQFRPEGRVGRL